MNRSKFGSLSRVRMLHPSFQRLLAAEGATLLLQRLGVRQIDAGRLIELHVLPELGDPRTSPSDLVDLMVYLKEYVLRSASRKDSGAEGGVIFPVGCTLRILAADGGAVTVPPSSASSDGSGDGRGGSIHLSAPYEGDEFVPPEWMQGGHANGPLWRQVSPKYHEMDPDVHGWQQIFWSLGVLSLPAFYPKQRKLRLCLRSNDRSGLDVEAFSLDSSGDRVEKSGDQCTSPAAEWAEMIRSRLGETAKAATGLGDARGHSTVLELNVTVDDFESPELDTLLARLCSGAAAAGDAGEQSRQRLRALARAMARHWDTAVDPVLTARAQLHTGIERPGEGCGCEELLLRSSVAWRVQEVSWCERADGAFVPGRKLFTDESGLVALLGERAPIFREPHAGFAGGSQCPPKMLDALGIRRGAGASDLLDILAGWAADVDASGVAPRASLGRTAAIFKYLAEALDAASEAEAAALRARLHEVRWVFVPDHPRPSPDRIKLTARAPVGVTVPGSLIALSDCVMDDTSSLVDSWKKTVTGEMQDLAAAGGFRVLERYYDDPTIKAALRALGVKALPTTEQYCRILRRAAVASGASAQR